ncbi:MAG: 2Fe-2S iron-sulfur cluster-binding protein [Gemmatimonadales bacterium]
MQVPVEGGVTVIALAARAGVPLRTVCGGIGNCTTCRVRVVGGEWPAGRTDHLRLGVLVGYGWRLACQFSPRGSLTIQPPQFEP